MAEEDGSTVRHLSVNDLAARQQVTAETVRTWNKRRTGPPYMRIGRHVRYRLVDVIKWEESRFAAGSSRRATS